MFGEENSAQLYLSLKLIDFGCATLEFSDVIGYSPFYFVSKKRKFIFEKIEGEDMESLTNPEKYYYFTTRQERIQAELFCVGMTVLECAMTSIIGECE